MGNKKWYYQLIMAAAVVIIVLGVHLAGSTASANEMQVLAEIGITEGEITAEIEETIEISIEELLRVQSEGGAITKKTQDNVLEITAQSFYVNSRTLKGDAVSGNGLTAELYSGVNAEVGEVIPSNSNFSQLYFSDGYANEAVYYYKLGTEITKYTLKLNIKNEVSINGAEEIIFSAEKDGEEIEFSEFTLKEKYSDKAYTVIPKVGWGVLSGMGMEEYPNTSKIEIKTSQGEGEYYIHVYNTTTFEIKGYLIPIKYEKNIDFSKEMTIRVNDTLYFETAKRQEIEGTGYWLYGYCDISSGKWFLSCVKGEEVQTISFQDNYPFPRRIEEKEVYFTLDTDAGEKHLKVDLTIDSLTESQDYSRERKVIKANVDYSEVQDKWKEIEIAYDEHFKVKVNVGYDESGVLNVGEGFVKKLGDGYGEQLREITPGVFKIEVFPGDFSTSTRDTIVNIEVKNMPATPVIELPKATVTKANLRENQYEQVIEGNMSVSIYYANSGGDILFPRICN